ncbi:MAG: hypothetical protein ABI364_01815 [Caldimonas sp.]
MRRATLLFTFGAALSLAGMQPAAAMGFGRTATATTLGQPLNFFANVALDADESLDRQCVGADVMIGDIKVAPENVRVSLESARSAGERRVRVTTRTIVDEPVVTIDVRIGCGSRMSRRFVAFVDPPQVRLASAEPEPFEPQRIDNQVAPLMDIVRSAGAARPRAARAEAMSSRDGAFDAHPSRHAAPGNRVAATAGTRSAALRRARADAPRAVAPSGPGTRMAAAARRTTPRLRLDAAAPMVAVAASSVEPGIATAADARAQLAANESVAQASADAANAALAGERERIQQLESGLARLRADAQAQQKTLGALQARLREAESDRYANGLVYFLAGGLVFFALLAAALYALRPRQRRGARWFDAGAQQRRAPAEAAQARQAAAAAEAARTPAVSQHPSQWNEGPTSILPVTAPATIGGLEVTTVLAPQAHYERMATAGLSANSGAPMSGRSGSPSMEELVDLEQQAEFFVVLGQDEAAIALLGVHLRSDGGGSPLPYLQLLEIHQRRDDRASYEEVREAFHRHFHAFAPEWSADLHFGRSLDEYPQAVARLQALWPTPLHAMQLLDSLLFRRSESEETFDFPAYRELLFLYSVARDLAGSVETDAGSIDLFLPLEEAPTEPIAHHDKSAFSVDLDISSWPEESSAEQLVIRRSVGRRGAG